MKALLPVFAFFYVAAAGAGAVTFINNSNFDARMYIIPRYVGNFTFEVPVSPQKTVNRSIKEFVQSLPNQTTIPWVLVQVQKNPIQETYCHPSSKPMSYYNNNDARIKIIYNGIGDCKTEGL